MTAEETTERQEHNVRKSVKPGHPSARQDPKDPPANHRQAMPDDEHVKPPAMADQSDKTLKAVIAGGFFTFFEK